MYPNFNTKHFIKPDANIVLCGPAVGLCVGWAYVACKGLEESPCAMASEAKVLRGYWQGFFRGQAMAHNEFEVYEVLKASQN